MTFLTADLLVCIKITLNYLVLHSCDFGDVGLRCLFKDPIDRDLVVDVSHIKRAFKQMINLIIARRE